jgi:threonine dehydratase
MNEPTLFDIQNAAAVLKPYIHRTPVLTSRSVDALCEAQLFFKCENFQKAGAFKIRGATNAIFSLDEDQVRNGVATHSSGNHAAAVALAARWRGIAATVVMPKNSAAVKINAVRGYGAAIELCEPTLKAREEGLARVVQSSGAVFIPPYNDYHIIAGQGTVAMELLQESTGLDYILVPVGGGGLLSGSAIATSALSPSTRVIGAEPENADDAYRSFHAGRIIPVTAANTIADGLRTSLGTLTFPIIKKRVFDILTVSEEAIIIAMRTIWERMKIIVEPSAVVPLGAILTHKSIFTDKKVGIILSGGNVDLERVPWK